MLETIKVSDLCERFDAKLVHFGYSADSLRRFRKVFKEFTEFSEEAFYSQKLGTEFLLDRLQRTGGFVTAGPNAKNDMYYLRAVRSLAEFYYYGTVFRRHDFKGAIVWPEEFRDGIESFLESLITAGRARHYVRNCSTLIKDFLLYLEAVGIFSPKDISSSHLSGFISTLVGFAPVTVSSRISSLRVYLRHLYLESFINEPLADMLPRTYQFARTKLPTVWTADETKKILHAVDLGNPCGKRDYAMILLTMRLGLRVGDVRNLKLKDIDWKAKQITIIQGKTRERLTLPLPEDAGWAIIDYLKTGRPVTDCPNVFVRNTPPFDEFTDSNNLHGMITRVIAKADIPPEKKKNVGMHTLRHSLATNLLQSQVDVPIISDILGHVDPGTAKHYLRVDISQLRLCALNIREVTGCEE